jgi:hypothetical protein
MPPAKRPGTVVNFLALDELRFAVAIAKMKY